MSEEKKDVVVPAKFEKLVSEIEKMSVLDLSELVTVLEDKFGVSAAAPMMMGAAPAAAAEAVEEKTDFDVELTAAGHAEDSPDRPMVLLFHHVEDFFDQFRRKTH